MANQNDLKYKIGEAEIPLSSTSTSSLLSDSDPAIEAVLKLLSYSIDHYLLSRFKLEANKVKYLQTKLKDKINPTDPDEYEFGSLVPTVIHYNPEAYLQTAQYKFPILALFRTQTTSTNNLTFAYQQKNSTWTLIYVMSPFNVQQSFSLNPILNLIENVVISRLKKRRESTYKADELVLDEAGIKDIQIMSSEFGDYTLTKSDQSTVIYPTLRMQIEVTERQYYVDEPILDGVDVTINVDGYNYDVLLQVNVDNP